MSAENQNSEFSTVNSQLPELPCQAVTSENREPSTELELQETKEPLGGHEGIRSVSAASNTSSEESVCSKCGGTKLNSRTDLETLPETLNICKCDSDLNETKEETINISGLESEAKTVETEGELSSMQKLTATKLETSGDSAEQTNDQVTSGPGSDNVMVSVKSQVLTSGDHMNDAESEEEEIALPPPHTDAAVREIVEMEEGCDGRQSPSVSSTRELLPRNPPHIRCRADSYSSQTNPQDCIDENLPLVLLACCILCPVLIFVSLALAYQLWVQSKEVHPSIPGDFDGNSTADEQ